MYSLAGAARARQRDLLAAGLHDRRAGRRRASAGAGDRLRRRLRGDALHAQLGAVLRRRVRRRVAGAAVAGARDRAPAAAAHRAARVRRASCSTCRGCRTRSTRPPTPARRGRRRRRSPRWPRPRPGCSASRPRSRCCSRPAPGWPCCSRAARGPADGARPRRRRAARDGGADDRRGLALLAALAGVGEPLPLGRAGAVAAARAPPASPTPGRLGLVGARSSWPCCGRSTAPRTRRATCATSRRRSRRRCAPATSSSRPSPSRSPCCTTTCPRGCATRR